MRLLGDGGTPFNSIEELAGRLTGSVPVVVILGPSCAAPSELGVAERLLGAHPALGAILIVEELSTTLLQLALRSGVRDVITFSGDSDQLAQAVQRVAVSLDNQPRRSARPARTIPRAARRTAARRRSTAWSSPCSRPKAEPASR